MSAVRVLERVTRPAPFGFRFLDVATGSPVPDGLDVTVTSTRNTARRAALTVNGKSVWYAHRFPGFADHVLTETPDWSALAQPCRVSVTDRLGRFLPLDVEIALPMRGIVDWPGWAGLPQALLAPLTRTDDASPPAVMRDALPLFSAAGRIAPGPLAEVRCQLLRDDTGAPAAWALLTASHGGIVRAIGQADAQGRVILFFAYPDRPRPSLATSPPAITDFRWSIELAAYWNALDPAATPDFAALMGQLTHPRTLFESTVPPRSPLPSQLLSFGRALVVRTAATPGGPSSSVVMATS
ncbi:hypothetical protein M0208_11555 [Sphingomonas sp. SUN019]|uniref:hypothetical protein n=1 Tax=Sphingomonas sp. SUN019 TaxID=2937788 RepID=UPI002164A29B|nr:hypothetical protein [Sphingomonas sp. SUN019]UVO51125.1 hypothetical protein M0208_11555 [Sphingomonas sp. SUN019]